MTSDSLRSYSFSLSFIFISLVRSTEDSGSFKLGEGEGINLSCRIFTFLCHFIAFLELFCENWLNFKIYGKFL